MVKNILAERTNLIDASGIRKVFALAGKLKDPLNFSIGQPDFDVPDSIKAAAIEAIRPETPCTEIDAVARDMIAERGYGDFFGHGLGHGVGLDVHESPTVSRLGRGNVKPGMVFTVEPGIYISGWGGVRLENMVVVNKNSCTLLNKDKTFLDL